MASKEALIALTTGQKIGCGVGAAAVIFVIAYFAREAWAAPPELKADAGGPYSGIANQPVTLKGSASGGTSPYSYAWDLDNDGIFETPGQKPTVTWAEEGSYTITLQVTDASGATATDSATVNITAAEEVAGRIEDLVIV